MPDKDQTQLVYAVQHSISETLSDRVQQQRSNYNETQSDNL